MRHVSFFILQQRAGNAAWGNTSVQYLVLPCDTGEESEGCNCLNVYMLHTLRTVLSALSSESYINKYVWEGMWTPAVVKWCKSWYEHAWYVCMYLGIRRPVKVFQHRASQEEQRPPVQPEQESKGRRVPHSTWRLGAWDNSTYDGTKSLFRTTVVMKLFEYSANG